MKMTVKEVAKLTGISVRTLHYYHREGILIPDEISPNKYRHYNEDNLKRLQQILFLRELDFSILEIKGILADPDYDQKESFQRQRRLLMLKRNRLDKLIGLLDAQLKGEEIMDFKAFDMKAIDKAKKDYQEETKARWGNTAAYAQSHQKTKNYSEKDWENIHYEAESIYERFVTQMDKAPGDPVVQELVARWQKHISQNYYECTKEILSGLGQMYSEDERFKKNIDSHAEGLAQFMSAAIDIYTK